MNTQMRMQQITKLGLILTILLSMSACSGDQKWKEEVQLSDGRIIVIERELIAEPGGGEWASNRSGVKPKEGRIRLEHPIGSGKTIEWHSEKKSPNKYPEMPLVLDMESGKPIIISSVFIAGGCQFYSKYLWEGNVWREESLPPQFEKRATNLLIFDSRNNQSIFNLDAKRKNNSDVTLNIFWQVGPKHPYCR